MYLDEDGHIKGFVPKPDLEKLIDYKLEMLDLQAPLNSIDIINSINSIILEFIPFKTLGIGGIIIKKGSDANIAINSMHSKQAKNFIGMHELVHYWFHPTPGIPCEANHNNKEGIEFQANYMAAQALMPRELFIRKYYEFNGNIPELAKYFYVTDRAANIRKDTLADDIKLSIHKYKTKKTQEECLRNIYNAAMNMKKLNNKFHEDDFGTFFVNGIK